MNFVLLYSPQGNTLERERLRKLLYTLEGVSEVEESPGDGACLKARYCYGGDSTIVELKDDMESIALSGVGDAGIDLALRIQEIYPEVLHIIDSDYSFELALDQFSSFSDLSSVIHDRMNRFS